MRTVLEVSPEERWARVQPGIVNNHLSAAVRQHGLMYGPDPVTSQRATIGGGIGNNSCGPHSVIYGKTIDHVLEIDAILSDGSRTHFAPVTGQPSIDRLSQQGSHGVLCVPARAHFLQHFPRQVAQSQYLVQLPIKQ